MPEGNQEQHHQWSHLKETILVVGEVAKRQQITNPNTVSSIKRHMGDANYKVEYSR